MCWKEGLLLTACFLVAHSQENVPITTKKGPIVGSRINTNPITKMSYDAFLGIPYGQIPARFQMAVPRGSWVDPLLTQSDGPACPQPGADFSEDCLYINVFTPMNASETPGALPVMVFIHGSAFTVSSSSSKIYGPDFLVAENIILVTMNYRLGAAGFLTLGSKVAPGNLGLYDTMLGLQWVQDEVYTFGGDPTRVTLFGHSAGSVMTQYHYLSPVSAVLFTRAIAQSGAAEAGWGHVTPTEGARRAKLLARALNCDTAQNDSVILSCLQKADIRDIVNNQSLSLPVYNRVTGNDLAFVPVLDTDKIADKPFFNDSLTNLMQQALTRAKPLITGFTSDEGISMFMKDGWKEAESNLAAFIPTMVVDKKKSELVSAIKNRFFPETPDLNKVQGLVQLYTETMFNYPAVKVARYFANLTYGYIFTYDGSWATPPPYFSQYRQRGVNHGDDLLYLFYESGSNQFMDSCAGNTANLNMMRQMVACWTGFAKTGVPDASWKVISDGGYRRVDSTFSNINSTYLESQFYNFWANMQPASNSSITGKLSVAALFVVLWGLASMYS